MNPDLRSKQVTNRKGPLHRHIPLLLARPSQRFARKVYRTRDDGKAKLAKRRVHRTGSSSVLAGLRMPFSSRIERDPAYIARHCATRHLCGEDIDQSAI